MKRHLPVQLFTIFFVLSIIGTIMHFDMIDRPFFEQQYMLHQKIVEHSAPAPYQYRVLQPFLVDTILHLLSAKYGTNTYSLLFMGSYALIRFYAILITFIAVFLALRMKYAQGTAGFGVTLLAVFIPFTYRYYYYQPTSILEMAFFALGLLMTLKRKAALLLPLVAIGTLNRETMCFIPLIYFMYWLPNLKRMEYVWLGVTSITFILIFMGLRIVWPAAGSLLDIFHYVSVNLTSSRDNLDLLLILSPLFILFFNVKQMSASSLRLALCSFPWLILHFFTSQWYEIRYYMPMLIWLLPGLMNVLVLEEIPIEIL